VSLTLWRFTDGRPGHDRQTRGLAQALQQRTDVSLHELPVRGGAGGFCWWLSGRYPPGTALPAPDLLLGAGHATHSHLLAARRSRGGRIVLCMKPSLPLSCFDLCLIPQHDTPPRADNVLATLGVLNDLRPGAAHDAARGLIVVGGPSRHHRWDNGRILAQIDSLIAARPLQHWRLTTSPRTPPELLAQLRGNNACEYVPFDSCADGWLAQQLAQAGEVWVSEDSVSMIYEALTAGARVGLLRVPRGMANRVTDEIDALVAKGWVGRPGEWQLASGADKPLDEAARCADWIQQWLVH
jgi:mitochondrial fission protein ELM1